MMDHTTAGAAARQVSARVLGEIEETSLEELLDSLRLQLAGPSPNPGIRPHIPIPALASLAGRYHRATQSAPPPVLSVSGRYLPLLYHLVSTLIAEPHGYAIAVVDTEGRFDVTRLIASHHLPVTAVTTAAAAAGGSGGSGDSTNTSTSYPALPPDLRHVYVYRPPQGQEHVRAAVAAASEWMVYGAHGSRAREWWGTVVIGGGSNAPGAGASAGANASGAVAGAGIASRGDVYADWKGWLRVEREEVPGFPPGISIEEALRDRERRQRVVDAAGWVASSQVGSYAWKDI
ncbi:hypothetical protein GGS23DRAFT_579056 [Durotheca rogersii]|uniref:uncharacterized protein n=1 Tax=Durotheca rogersii TaxID=419775 RepID=UPI00221E8F8D|nr:uncharacterized protein GGS23DRAFT_579056 [Durotheca rogersii]KAI5860819.1 hypothetical protein GGS23DRAFT_579056 [Durotheca rogersii]